MIRERHFQTLEGFFLSVKSMKEAGLVIPCVDVGGLKMVRNGESNQCVVVKSHTLKYGSLRKITWGITWISPDRLIQVGESFYGFARLGRNDGE